MLPDSDEVNLSPAELQILSELDRSVAFNQRFSYQIFCRSLCLFKINIWFDFCSRQFGFLRLNNVEHRKKKAVVVKVRSAICFFFSIFTDKWKISVFFQAIKYLERMLIQDYCQQEREKRCTITANTAESNSKEKNESNTDQVDTNESNDTDDGGGGDGAKTPKSEPNPSPKTNDVEMVDATDPIPTIKQEPEDEVISIETDPLAETTTTTTTTTSDENVGKTNESSDAQPNIQVVKTEADENGNVDDGNDSNKESSNKDSQSDSTSEPIKIEESTSSDKDDPYSKDINIDPRTYCKLGHFHLLLEDYAKGNIFRFSSFDRWWRRRRLVMWIFFCQKIIFWT